MHARPGSALSFALPMACEHRIRCRSLPASSMEQKHSLPMTDVCAEWRNSTSLCSTISCEVAIILSPHGRRCDLVLGAPARAAPQAERHQSRLDIIPDWLRVPTGTMHLTYGP